MTRHPGSHLFKHNFAKALANSDLIRAAQYDNSPGDAKTGYRDSLRRLNLMPGECSPASGILPLEQDAGYIGCMGRDIHQHGHHLEMGF